MVCLQGVGENGILPYRWILDFLKDVTEGSMQEYYNKKAKECEVVIARLQQQIDQIKAADGDSLRAQMVIVRREMKNYQAAIAAVEA
jgi:hypothetical protein